MKLLFNLIDWFIKPSLKGENDRHQKARLIVAMHFISVAYCLIHIIVYYFIQYYTGIFALSIVLTTTITGLLLYKKTATDAFVTNLIILGCFIGFTIFIYSSGGIYSPTVSWLLPVSLIGFLFADKRSGYIWSIISVTTILAFFLLNLFNVSFPMLLPQKWLSVHYAISFSGSSFFVLIIVVIYDTINRQINREIKEKSDLLEVWKVEILSQNSELSKQKEEIEAQRDEIVNQKAAIESKNKNLTDSIHYALRIQEAMLPKREILSENLPEHFIFYKPCDIISGDFYWFKQVKNYIYIVVADCTGHGVPGALMSMLGISHLNEIVTKRELKPPHEVLNELRKRVKKSLHQDGTKGQTHDGMDVALCAIDIIRKTIQFSGANSSMFLLRKNEAEYELVDVKADKMPIGVHPKENDSFTNHEIKIQSNDTIYLLSDGYVSQFGGHKLEKFKTKRLKELLTKIQDQPMETQKEILKKTLMDWKGKHELVDDVLMIGIRLNNLC